MVSGGARGSHWRQLNALTHSAWLHSSASVVVFHVLMICSFLSPLFLVMTRRLNPAPSTSLFSSAPESRVLEVLYGDSLFRKVTFFC